MKTLMKSRFGVCFWSVLLALGMLMSVFPGTAAAKSLYVNKDLRSPANSPIRAYDIQSPPTYLFWQMDSPGTRYGGAGLTIDTDSAILFVTFEGSGTLDIVDALTLTILGQVTAPNASDLAGIVVDQDKQKIYAVDRNTNHLYVYSWDANTTTLTNDVTTSPYYITLSGISTDGHGSGLHGIALDEINDLLYVADVTTIVKVFNTSDWSSAGNLSPVSQDAMGIAVDVANGFVYTGNAYPPYGSTGLLCQYDLNSNAETATVNIRTLTMDLSDNVVGLSVDPSGPFAGLLYITTGNQASGGSDQIMVFDSNLNLLHSTGAIGNPTGICVPGKEISYNPLKLSKDDGIEEDDDPNCVPAGGTITYDICYDNNDNAYDVHNVTITDDLAAEVSFASATAGGVYDSNTHRIIWNIGTLPAGDPGGCVQLVVQVIPGTPGGTIIGNVVKIESDETGPTTQTESTQVCINQPPDCSEAYADPDCLWPPNHKMVSVNVLGVTDPDGDPVTITITGITSDEATASDEGAGGAKHAPDAAGVGTDTASLRAERSGKANGRVYVISFTATDGKGAECEGSVEVKVPHDQRPSRRSPAPCEAVDDGQVNDATQIN